MAKQLDVLIQDFKDGLAEYVNSSPLTLEIKRLVMHEYMDKVTKISTSFIAQERAKEKTESEKLNDAQIDPESQNTK